MTRNSTEHLLTCLLGLGVAQLATNLHAQVRIPGSQSIVHHPLSVLSIEWVQWGTLGKANCGKPSVTPALCPRVMVCCYPPQAQVGDESRGHAQLCRMPQLCLLFGFPIFYISLLVQEVLVIFGQ